MIELISKRVVGCLLRSHAIVEEEFSIYKYGCELFLSMIINTCFILCQGLLMNKLSETFIFMVCFIPIRAYVGGFHASSFIRCIILTNSRFAVSLGVIYPLLERYENCCLFLFVLFSIINWKISPIIDCDVTWKKKEDMQGYKEKAHCLIIMLLIIVLVIQQTEFSVRHELLIVGTVASLNIMLLLFVSGIKRKMRCLHNYRVPITTENLDNN